MTDDIQHWIPLWLSSDTNYASTVDLLFIGLLATTIITLALLFFLLLRFVVHYRAGNTRADRSGRTKKSWRWELSWTAVTLMVFLCLFAWAAELYLEYFDFPKNASVVYVVAQQWMWKVQHVGGQREIDELHVPVGQATRLVMSSQDVIHSFFVPAFRIKRDVLPGRFENIWFRPSRTGTFNLFCAEYCGTDHSRMLGKVVVMSKTDFAHWLDTQDTGGTLASEGRQLFQQFGCSGCHDGASVVRSPDLAGLYGRPVPLSDGSIVTADERYLRDAIIHPRLEVVAGYEPTMPSFEGKVSEDELIKLIGYIKSLGSQEQQHG